MRDRIQTVSHSTRKEDEEKKKKKKKKKKKIKKKEKETETEKETEKEKKQTHTKNTFKVCLLASKFTQLVGNGDFRQRGVAGGNRGLEPAEKRTHGGGVAHVGCPHAREFGWVFDGLGHDNGRGTLDSPLKRF